MVEILYYAVSHDGMNMDKKKVVMIQAWEGLTCMKDVQFILGFANFYFKFIQDSQGGPSPQLLSYRILIQSSLPSLKKMLQLWPLHCPISIYGHGTMHPIQIFSRICEPVDKLFNARKQFDCYNSCIRGISSLLKNGQHFVQVMTNYKTLMYFTTRMYLESFSNSLFYL